MRMMHDSAPAAPVHAAEAAAQVEIDHVTIEFPKPRGGGTVLAVQDVSVNIRKGEKFVILGPSGCGKSTLLTAIGGFIPVTGGQIRVAGEVVRKPNMNRILVFQDFGQLLPWRTVVSNVAWAIGKRWPHMKAAEVQERARHYVDVVGLSTQADQYPNTLSGGQKQRCAIARAFAVKPGILLMDEPFGALDAINREKMQFELNRLWGAEEEKVTIAFVTHDVNEAVHLGHRIMVMSRGPGRLRELVDNPSVGQPPHDASALRLVDDLRELLKDAKA
ncbi:ABC transporter ATP-binding protein [Ramlibacter tataouinensis]|uniref:ABC transporter ATP-binding protein n=1 Tax=Ramlibacter tataouinensis TaxID=94132 RepID=UPI0022F3F258|nr:ABC transporter ATP-binding protein [Ramlibacter tataouinensis]WBY01059.1 ABC transporter ATP-binding protein [Ramlibacter tataouinensis]